MRIDELFIVAAATILPTTKRRLTADAFASGMALAQSSRVRELRVCGKAARRGGVVAGASAAAIAAAAAACCRCRRRFRRRFGRVLVGRRVRIARRLGVRRCDAAWLLVCRATWYRTLAISGILASRSGWPFKMLSEMRKLAHNQPLPPFSPGRPCWPVEQQSQLDAVFVEKILVACLAPHALQAPEKRCSDRATQRPPTYALLALTAVFTSLAVRP